MHCSLARRQLSALLDHELDDSRVAAVRAHLAACAECRAILRQYRVQQQQLADALRQAPFLPVADRVMTLARGDRRWTRRRRSPHPPGSLSRLLSAAALVALAAFVGLSAMAIRGMGRARVAAPTSAALAPASASVSPVSTATMQILESTVTALKTPQATAPAPPATPPMPATFDPTLASLQSTAGFELYSPTSLPDGLELATPKAPMRLAGFTSVIVDYLERDGSLAFSLTEASPYQDSRDTMPSDIWDASVPQDLGDGRSGRLYDDGKGGLQLWWQEGPTSIRLETSALTRAELLSVAKSLQPISTEATPEATAIATPGTGDQEVTLARQLINSLGGNTQATLSSRRLTTLAEPAATGLTIPDDKDGTTAIWLLEFDNGLSPAGCPAVGTSVCAHGLLVVVVDAGQPAILGWHADDGVWKTP